MSMLPALINESGKALTKAASKTAKSELSKLIGNEVIGATTKGLASATTKGLTGATTKKIASSLLGNSLPISQSPSISSKIPVKKNGVIISNLINRDYLPSSSLQDIFESLGDSVEDLSNRDLRDKFINTISSSSTPESYKKELLYRSPMAVRAWRSGNTLSNILNNDYQTELPRSQAITIGANLHKLVENFGADEHGDFSDTFLTGMNLKDLMKYSDGDVLSNGVGFGAGDAFTPYGYGSSADEWKNWQNKAGILSNLDDDKLLDRYWSPINENIYEDGRVGEFNGYDTPFDEYVSRIDKNSIAQTTSFPKDLDMADEYDMADKFLNELLSNPNGDVKDILDRVIVGAKNDKYYKQGSYKFNKNGEITRGRGWFADNKNNPHISKLLKDTGADKYLGQPKNPVNMSVYDGYRSGYGGFANDVKSIGNSNVAPIDKSTLPENYEFFSDLTKKNKAKYGWVYDAVSKETGKPASRITNADLKKYLEDYYPDYVSDGKMTKYDLEKSINDAMEDEMTDLGYENSADLSVVVHNRPGNAGIRDLYNDHSGRTGRIDRELSKRLGIGESTSVMADKLLRAGYGDAAGDATGNMMGIDYGSWYGDNDETNLGTVAHERFHLMQDAANGFDYEQVQPAYNELHDELQKAMLNEDELRKAHSNFDRKGMGYWGNYKEQEARMLEAYLYDEGYTKARPIREEEFRDKMDIIKPAFDKFFNKLRELSKKGVALPAVAIASLFGLNKENDEESVDNIQ